MEGIEKITQMIQAETDEEIARLLKEGRAKAGKIAASYRAQAAAEAADLETKSKKAAKEKEERQISVSQMEARKVILAAKQAVLEKAYERALALLCAMPEGDLIDILAHLLIQASFSGSEEVIFSPKDREGVGLRALEKANQTSGKKLVLSPETRPIQGGFILKDRFIEVNCTFPTLVRLSRDKTSGEVAKRLFSQAKRNEEEGLGEKTEGR